MSPLIYLSLWHRKYVQLANSLSTTPSIPSLLLPDHNKLKIRWLPQVLTVILIILSSALN